MFFAGCVKNLIGPCSCRVGARNRTVFTKPRAHYNVSVHKRRIVRLVAFCGGASIYFFLPDPSSLQAHSTQVLSPTRFTQGKLLSSEPSGPNSKLLTIAIPPHLIPKGEDTLSITPIWSVFIKDDDIQVERPYTPLEGLDENGHLHFWIKNYQNGEVGRWLHSKAVGDIIELRGPVKTWPWEENTWDEVVMISGGTGITPFYQLFHNLISQPGLSPNTRFVLLHSSRSPEQLPPAAIMSPLLKFAENNPDTFRIEVFVDSDEGQPAPYPLPRLNIGRIGEREIRKAVKPESSSESWWSKLFGSKRPSPSTSSGSENVLFLICGPEPMVNAISGPFGRNFSQGPIKGVLGSIGYTSKQVWKL